VVDPGKSRKTRVSATWRATSSDEEARSYLQARLAVLSRLMFWAFVTLLVGLSVMYWGYPAIKPAHNDLIMAGSAIGMCVLAFIWRVGLVRKTLSMRFLDAIDLFYTSGTGLVFATSAYLSADFAAAPYACILYVSFVVLTRATVVPSTGRRTAAVSTLAFFPMVVAAVGIGLSSHFTALPGPALVGATIAIGTIVVLLATAGSQTTYGLRKQTTEALRLGQYTLERKVKQGGMGVVYKAHHAMLARPTAIKLIQPELGLDVATISRFEREVRQTSRLTHPNTVAVFDYGRNRDGVFYYAMEYLDGLDLEDLVRKDGAQPADRVIHILAQVCGSLHEAHTKHIIHRDIKPSNVMLCERGGVFDVAKVVDFGLVKEMAIEDGASKQILQCLAKQPENRPASAEELARALRAVPASGDWDDDDARRFWTKFAQQQDLVETASSLPTMTISVDVKQRT
jgi:tRNA A-37 threonylcarbamoyl transferase component Bud32